MNPGIQDQLLYKIREIRRRLADIDKDALPESNNIFMRGILLSEELLPNGICAAKMSDVKKVCGFQKAKTARIASKLESQGYIVKINADFDRRAKYVALTPEGREKSEKEGKLVHTLADSVIGKLGDSETIHLITLLDKLSEIMASTAKAVGNK